ncbi:hypothetical protein IJI31_04855 [bacterium]|nr:hypothetical protein [bacterium]
MSIGAINSVNAITSFRAAEATKPISAEEQVLPKYYETAEMPKEKKGFFNRLKEGFINIRKFFITTGYMLGGAVKGTAVGAVGGAATLGALALKNTIKKAPEVLTKGNKVAAAAVGVGILAIELVKAKLNANDRGADLDHKWRTGHDRN